MVLESAALAVSVQAGHKQQDYMAECQDCVVEDMVVAHTAVVVAVDTVEDTTADYAEQEEDQDSSWPEEIQDWFLVHTHMGQD